MEISIIAAFGAGLLTFLAPCTLPLVPAYLAYISGASPEEENYRRRIVVNGAFFVLGFSLVFILFGYLLGALGVVFGDFRIWITRIGGILIILFGLTMLGVFDMPFLKAEHRPSIASKIPLGKAWSSFLIGAIFGVGWSPCLGPILGGILTLAATSGTAGQGAFLLLVFSAGLAVPFLLTAFAYSRAQDALQKLTGVSRYVNLIGGALLLIIGMVLLSGSLEIIAQLGERLLGERLYGLLLDRL